MLKAAVLAIIVALVAISCASGVVIDDASIPPIDRAEDGGQDVSAPRSEAAAVDAPFDRTDAVMDVVADVAISDQSANVRESGSDVRSPTDVRSSTDARDIGMEALADAAAPMLDVSAGRVNAGDLIGVNDIGFWRGGINRAQLRQSMVNMGAHAVRIPFANFAADAPGTADTAAWRQSVVDSFLATGITPIPVAFFSRSGREVTCGTDPAALAAVVDDWVGDDAAWLRTRNVVLNIANEFGPGDPAAGMGDPGLAVWRDAYVSAVQRIRGAGITVPLLIDAPGCGQNAYGIERFGATVAAADPLGKVMFSVHLYGFWTSGAPQSWQFGLSQHADLLRATGLPIVFGEFSSSEFRATTGPGVLDPADVIAAAKARGFGWLPWEVYNDNPPEQLLNGPNNSPQPYPPASNLTPFGQVVAAALLGRAP